MPSYTQADRLIGIETPLGKDKLLLQGFSGHEGVSRLFEFNLDLLSADPDITFRDIVGRQVTFSVRLADGGQRSFNGFVSRFAQSGMDVRFTHYSMQVVPWLWFLTRNADCRIFQNTSIPDIIKKVFKNRGFSDFRVNLVAEYEPREYCVQYRETDFNFVSRLMEQYGIFYFFEHEQGKHTLVLGDSPSGYEECPGQRTAQYNQTTGDLDAEDVITSWVVEQEMRTGKCALNDYNFTTPATSLLATDNSVVEVGGNTRFEIYDYPGEYPTPSQGKSLAKIRMEEQESTHLVAAGSSVCRAFTPGYTFELAEHYRADANMKYLLSEVQHLASEGGSYSLDGGTIGETYSNRFKCVPASLPFRPARITPKPSVQGPQTALVVGKSGEEIWVDNYGRVTVQFYWDREGQKNENSSCWIRVSQPWAGKNWGAMWVPRIGQEVIVSFLEGDPDRPVITGRVYNADQTVPYSLPDKQTVSTLMSRSSKEGQSGNYNEIRFEDKKANEQIFINAERDMDCRVEVDSREFVGSNRSLQVGTNQLEQVAGEKHLHVKSSQFEAIDSDTSLTLGANFFRSIAKDEHLGLGNDRKENVGNDVNLNIGHDQNVSIANNASLNVGTNYMESITSDRHSAVGANRIESVGADMHVSVSGDTNQTVGGKLSVNVTGDHHESVGTVYALDSGQEIHLKGGMKVVIEGGIQLSLKVGGSFVDIGPAGVTIQGPLVRINSGGSAGSGTDASPKSPKSPKAPKAPAAPTAPTAPKDPQIADDGSKFGEVG
jgi:type VI secretion system secreted protein VgrG